LHDQIPVCRKPAATLLDRRDLALLRSKVTFHAQQFAQQHPAFSFGRFAQKLLGPRPLARSPLVFKGKADAVDAQFCLQ
jgi:hypothetical protein